MQYIDHEIHTVRHTQSSVTVLHTVKYITRKPSVFIIFKCFSVGICVRRIRCRVQAIGGWDRREEEEVWEGSKSIFFCWIFKVKISLKITKVGPRSKTQRYRTWGKLYRGNYADLEHVLFLSQLQLFLCVSFKKLFSFKNQCLKCYFQISFSSKTLSEFFSHLKITQIPRIRIDEEKCCLGNNACFRWFFGASARPQERDWWFLFPSDFSFLKF